MELKTLLTEEQIQKRIRELTKEITKDFQGHEIVVVGVLKGSFLFMADLVRHLTGPLTCDFLRMSSYDSEGRSTGSVRLEFDLTQPVDGRNVLLVEDIVDTGLTASYLLKHLKEKNPRSVKLCTLLHKRVEKIQVPIDYLGFEIPNDYVVGYGMDLDGQYRHLPYIARVINVTI
ncbi:MAG: hypoxanthine phosphoribosyltransferase [Deltaproteobacteria bacterium]|nr:hypoxanthine phosphoribosyltransferase [Deltaproteobacteria bacterium]